MKIQEMFEKELPGYRTDAEDNSSLKLSDVRKTRLTLMQLNRLRMMNDIRALEQEEQIKRVQKQYKPAAEPSGLM